MYLAIALADGGGAAPFLLPPIELDAVLDIDIAPVAEASSNI